MDVDRDNRMVLLRISDGHTRRCEVAVLEVWVLGESRSWRRTDRVRDKSGAESLAVNRLRFRANLERETGSEQLGRSEGDQQRVGHTPACPMHPH